MHKILGFTRREMQEDFKKTLQELGDFTEGLPINNFKGKSMRVARELDVDAEVFEAFEKYRVDERKLTKEVLRKRDNIQTELRRGLEDIRDWSKGQKKKGTPAVDVLRGGDKKLQVLKLKIDRKLQKLKKEGFKDFDDLEKKHVKETPEVRVVIEQSKDTVGQIVGKKVLAIALGFLGMIILGFAAKTIVLPAFMAIAPEMMGAAKDAVLPALREGFNFGRELREGK